MRCVLVSCCGLPAAGKTTFCRCVATSPVTMPAVSWTSLAAPATPGARTETLGAERETKARIRVSHVCFDEHIKRSGRRRRRPSSSDNSSPSGTRTIPDPVLGTGDETVHTARATEMVPRAGLAAVSEDGARAWHEGRQAALAEIEASASTQNTTTACTVEASHSSADRRPSALSSEAAASAIHVVLVDDNMHFRTMRHEVFRLARKCECASRRYRCGLLWTSAVVSNPYPPLF